VGENVIGQSAGTASLGMMLRELHGNQLTDSRGLDMNLMARLWQAPGDRFKVERES